MKLNFIILIFLNILIINFINGYEYINFIPFNNSQCSGDTSNEGVGYAIVVDTCFTLDNSTNHIIQVRGDTVVWRDFYDVQGSADCVVPIEQPTQKAELGSCIPADFTFNSFLKPISSQTLYYFVYQTSEPAFQANSYVTTFMADDCDDDQVLLAQYVMNNTQIAYGSKANSITFFCNSKNNLPYTQFCPPGSDGSCFPPIPTSLTCHETIPFFNSSSEEFPMTTGASSVSTGSVVSTGNPSSVGSSSSSSSSSSGGRTSTSINTGDDGITGGTGDTGAVDTGTDDTGTGGGTGVTSGGNGGDSGSTGISTGGGGGGSGDEGGSIVTGGRYHSTNIFYGGGNGAITRNKVKSESIPTIKHAVFLPSSYQTSYYTSIYCI
ncbi:hypothetical protein ACTA71_012255 [Dictyostelium dimigraforme]